jgi:hypothetical protein
MAIYQIIVTSVGGVEIMWEIIHSALMIYFIDLKRNTQQTINISYTHSKEKKSIYSLIHFHK